MEIITPSHNLVADNLSIQTVCLLRIMFIITRLKNLIFYFREFFYIQMEKYARQALQEGVKDERELLVNDDHELYRVLNVHYNRNNHIEVSTGYKFIFPNCRPDYEIYL